MLREKHNIIIIVRVIKPKYPVLCIVLPSDELSQPDTDRVARRVHVCSHVFVAGLAETLGCESVHGLAEEPALARSHMKHRFYFLENSFLDFCVVVRPCVHPRAGLRGCGPVRDVDDRGRAVERARAAAAARARGRGLCVTNLGGTQRLRAGGDTSQSSSRQVHIRITHVSLIEQPAKFHEFLGASHACTM